MGAGASVSDDNISKEKAKEIAREHWNEDLWNEKAAGADSMPATQWDQLVKEKGVKKSVKDYRRLKRLGKGAYGVVDLVRRRDGELFVMKIVKDDTVVTKNNHVQSSFGEAKILSELNHPNIVGLADYFVEGKYLLLILEYCDSGDLKIRITTAAKKQRQFHETQVMDWFVQMCFAMEYLHERKLAHRDIKPQNVFLTRRNKIVKLGDLGVTRKLDSTLESMKTMVGTPYYMAPELAQGKGYNLSNDVWALGCVLAETMLLQVPFPARDFMSLVEKITKDKHLPIPAVYSDNVRSLVDWMLNKKAIERPTVAQVLERDFVQSHIQGFIKRYSESAEKAGGKDAKEKERLKQEALKQQIAAGDGEVQKLKEQIMKEADAGKKGDLEKQLQSKREEIIKTNQELHSSVHISDEDRAMSTIIEKATKKR